MSSTIYSSHYYARYVKFIEACRDQVISESYTEKHHIIPRSLGGSNDADNLIILTGRQHFIAHWMLWKAYRGKMTRAFSMMTGRLKYKLTSRIYNDLKEQYRNDMRGANNPNANGITEEHKRNIGKGLTGYKHSAKACASYKRVQSDPAMRAHKSIEAKERLKDPAKMDALLNQLITMNKDPVMRALKSKKMSSKLWCNDGVRNYRRESNDIPSHFVIGRL